MSTRKVHQAAPLLESELRQLQQGQLEQAHISGKRVLELAPQHPDALHLLGIIALHRGDNEGAVERIGQAVALRPDHPAYHSNQVHAYVGLQQLPEALAAFERAGTGKTARVLMPWPAEWRWMLSGEDSPWFPGFRIYQQKLEGSWDDAVERLNAELLSTLRPWQ